MSGLSGMSTDTRNKAIVVGLFVLAAAAIVYWNFYGSSTPNPAASVPAVATPAASTDLQQAAATPAAPAATATHATGNAARRIAGSSAALDPALRMDAMLVSESVEYSGSGRNIFSPNSAPPVVIPKPIAPVRPVSPVEAPPVRTGPPPPPPIDLTFWGTEADAAGKLQAILLQGDVVYTAQAGDIVLRRYRIVAVNAKSIQVEDMVTNNKQTLPLVAN